MQIVIKIPEDEYRWIKKSDNTIFADIAEKECMLHAIKNGTPLPKGHGRLIDADKTISEICGSSCGCHLEECGNDNPCYSVARISSASPIIEADKAESEE